MAGELTGSQQEWLRVRRRLVAERYPLGVRAGTFLTRPEWMPAAPVPLRDVRLSYDAARPYDGVTGAEADLPTRPDGSRYARYSEVVRDLAPPAVLRNLPTYRLLDADLDARDLVFGPGRYFDGLDTGEAAAHEYAADGPRPLRTAVGDPTDLTRRPVIVAISALTLRHDRHDRRTGAVTMPLHHRDPRKVGHAGGLIQVLPVGVFQPAGPEPGNVEHDLSLWRCLLREYAEELLGAPEDYVTPIDYDGWPFAARLTAAARPYVLGLGVDPLTFATDLLAAVVLDADAYDDLFAAPVAENAEGTVLPDVPFTAATVDRYATREPMQAAGAVLLRLAQRHREALLD